MQQQLKQYSLVNPNYQKHDPRQLAYLYPDSITRSMQSFISYNKKLQTFLYNHSLDAATQAANMFGCILVPTNCLHWRRAKQIAERRIFIGRNSFYIVKPTEINKNELSRLQKRIAEVREIS